MFGFYKLRYLASLDIVHSQRHAVLCWQLIADGRCRIEGIRKTVVEGKRSGNRFSGGVNSSCRSGGGEFQSWDPIPFIERVRLDFAYVQAK